MVDVTQAMESEYVNVDLIRESPTKKAVILNEGVYEEAEYQGKKYNKFNLLIEIDHKQKIWSPNKDSVKNIAEVHGRDSKNWVGKLVLLRIIKQNGKDLVIGLPVNPQ